MYERLDGIYCSPAPFSRCADRRIQHVLEGHEARSQLSHHQFDGIWNSFFGKKKNHWSANCQIRTSWVTRTFNFSGSLDLGTGLLTRSDAGAVELRSRANWSWIASEFQSIQNNVEHDCMWLTLLACIFSHVPTTLKSLLSTVSVRRSVCRSIGLLDGKAYTYPVISRHAFSGVISYVLVSYLHSNWCLHW